MSEKTTGLRERKRQETRRILESATVELVDRDGLEQTTIEKVCKLANVSSRTFFNYFDSKEDAILGIHVVDTNDDQIGGYLRDHPSDNTVELVVGLILSFIGPSLTDRGLYVARRKIIRKHPQLLERQMNRTIQMSERFVVAIKRVAQESEDLKLSEMEAEVLLALCSSAVRVVIREWLDTNKKLSLSKLEQDAMQIINKITKKV